MYPGNLEALKQIPIEEIENARLHQSPHIITTPMVRLNLDVPGKEIYLKLENMQLLGSFKVRGAYNALRYLMSEERVNGVVTSSSGNFGQGVAWSSKQLGIPCTVLAPRDSARNKLAKIEALGATLRKVSRQTFYESIATEKVGDIPGQYISVVCNQNVIAGQGVIGLEILEEVPDLDYVVCCWGGGSHALGIASVMKARSSHATVIACEEEAATPLALSLKAGHPILIKDHTESFVTGMNGRSVFKPIWNLTKNLIKRSVVVSHADICAAIRMLLVRNKIFVETASAATVAAALSNKVPSLNGVSC